MKKKITLLMASLCLCVGTTKAATWVSPLVSSDTETYLYYIKNSRNADYYVTTTSGLNGGEQQLGSANSFNDSKAKVVFKLMANGKLYATNVGETPLVVGYTTTDGGANSVQLFTADNSYTWRIALEGSDNAVAGFSLNAGSSTNSWNMHGGAGANIGLYGNTDGGSTWVFEPANEAATANSNSISAQNKLSNTSIYTITTAGRGAWLYSRDKNALTSTNKVGVAKNVNDVNQQFAFLTMNGETYLYSVGAQKFVIKSGGSTTLSDKPLQGIQFVASTGSLSPIVLAFNGYHAGVSNGYDPAVITSYNSTNDAGNQSIILPTGLTGDFSTALAAIETAQLPMAQADLQNSIDAANAWAAVAFLSEAKEADLTAAIQTATEAKNATDATFSGLKAAKTALDNTIATIPGSEVGGFSNNGVYTFISKRSDNAYMMYDGTNDFVASQYKQTSLEVGADKANCQWAVYKSEKGNYYMYNLGAGKFMGTESNNNTAIPLTDTPVTTNLKLKITSVASHPIMISSDNIGAVNCSNADFSTYGVVNWAAGWNVMADNGNVHNVVKVAEISLEVLTAIEEKVNYYENKGQAIQTLEAAIATAQAKVNVASDALGYYSSSNANVAADLAAIVEFKNAITDETTVEAIEAQTAAAEAITASFSVNLPKQGKYYRFSYDYGGEAGVKYVQAVASGASNKGNGMLMSAEQGAESIFYYADGKLLSYSAGLYVRENGDVRGLQEVGATAGAASFTAGSVAGKLYIYTDHSFHANISNDIYFVDHCGTGHADAHNFTVEEVTTLPVTISDAGYATFYAPVEVTLPEGVTAHTVTENGNYAILSEAINVVPANNGVILAGEAGTYQLTITTTGAEDLDNALAGTVAKTLVTKTEGDAYYVLAKQDDKVGLYNPVNGGNAANFYNASHKAYWHISAAAQSAGYRFGEGTTGIDTVKPAVENVVIYDLAGRRVEKMEKGIYIVNGRKVVIR